jgi:hypothetical protein
MKLLERLTGLGLKKSKVKVMAILNFAKLGHLTDSV